MASEAYAPLYASNVRTAVLLLLGLGMAMLASFHRTPRGAPSESCGKGRRAWGAGALRYASISKQVTSSRNLANEFNHMTAQLQASYAELEQRVEARTHGHRGGIAGAWRGRPRRELNARPADRADPDRLPRGRPGGAEGGMIYGIRCSGAGSLGFPPPRH